MSIGSMFHRLGAQTENALNPYVLNTKARYKRRGAKGISPSVVNQPQSDSVALKISLE